MFCFWCRRWGDRKRLPGRDQVTGCHIKEQGDALSHYGGWLGALATGIVLCGASM